jgi:hypothetical protein
MVATVVVVVPFAETVEVEDILEAAVAREIPAELVVAVVVHTTPAQVKQILLLHV